MRSNERRTGHVTMRDVAKAAGVSQVTVSRVLNQSNAGLPISEETRQRVQDAVKQLGYYPNRMAQSLRTQRTELIAIMIADLSNPFYHSIVRTVQTIARTRNYDVLIANTDQIYDYEKHFCQAVMRRGVDGVIMVPYHLTTEELSPLVDRTGGAVVVLGQHVNHPSIDVVYADDERATFEGVRWLIDQKHHREIGFIGVLPSFPPGERRYRGYVQAMQASGLPVQPDWIQQGDFTVDSGREAILKLLKLPQPPTAVFVCNDLMALGAISAAQDAGYRVPEDIAVMGFDNIPEGLLIRPHLTTIGQHPVEIGQRLIEALFDRIEGRETGARRLFEVECEIIERQSV